jgi:Domain of unknown function (DUF932)
MNQNQIKRLDGYIFPVMERKVFFEDEKSGKPVKTAEYKAIVRPDQNKLVSIMQDSYKLVSNHDVIMPLLEQLNNLDTNWFFDNSHSFVNSKRMRLQVTFPDLTLNDGRSDIALSLFLHNSYDGSEGIRIFWGAIRGICSNGMVFGEVLAKFYSKHTKNINISNLKEQLEETYEKIPVIKQRIEILQSMKVSKGIAEEVEHRMGKTIYKYVEEQTHPANQWILYNILTYYVSHLIDKRMRAYYQMKISGLFQL